MRARLPWMATYLLTFAWPMALPIYERTDERWPWMLVAATLFFAVSRVPSLFTPIGRVPLVLLVLAFGSLAAVLPPPYRAATLLLAAGAAADFVRRRFASCAFLPRGLGLAGCVFGLQAALVPFSSLFLANHHRIPGVGPVFALLLKPLWPRAAYSDGTLFVPAPEQVYEFTPSWEALGVFSWALFASSGLALLVACGATGRRLGAYTLLATVYLVWRYLALVFVVVAVRDTDVYWRSFPVAVGFLPLAILCAILLPLDARASLPGGLPAGEAAAPFGAGPRLHGNGGRTWGVTVAGFVAGLGLAGALAFHDPGAPKAGRILIDERHSDWEWTTQKFDTEWYGRKSGYNYYCLADWLRCYFEVDIRDEELTSDLLSRYDILFVKTPTTAFSPAEVEAVRGFVAAGGGLFLDGDHTNVFGTSTYLNELARPYGLRFRYDATYDLATGDLSVWERPRLAPHPVVRHVPPYLFATSCTLEGPVRHEPVIVGYALRAMYLDYARTSFFPAKVGVTNDEFGLFLQAAAVTYGRGRVLGYTDSTCFSNFFMFIPGKPELALGCFDWLNRRNRLGWVNEVSLLAGLLGLAAAFALGRRRRDHALYASAGAGAAGLVLAILVAARVDRAAYPPLEPARPPVTIAFEREHSRYTLPDLQLTRSNDTSFHTFFVWTQRLGFVPRAYPTLEEAVDRGNVVVIIDPQVGFSVSEMDRVYRFLHRGGRLLVMCDPRDPVQVANQAVGGLAMNFEPVAVDSTTLQRANGERLALARHAGAVSGGTPLLFREDGKAVLAAADRGKGRLLAMAAPHVFTDRVMGATGIVPTEEQRHIYDLEFWMLRDLLVGMEPLSPALPPGATPPPGPRPGTEPEAAGSR